MKLKKNYYSRVGTRSMPGSGPGSYGETHIYCSSFTVHGGSWMRASSDPESGPQASSTAQSKSWKPWQDTGADTEKLLSLRRRLATELRLCIPIPQEERTPQHYHGLVISSTLQTLPLKEQKGNLNLKNKKYKRKKISANKQISRCAQKQNHHENPR